MGDDLGVGLAGEDAAARDQRVAKGFEIFDDAIVDDGNLIRGMGMGVVRGRAAMRRPARMGDADSAGEWLGLKRLGKVAELSRSAASLNHVAIDGGNAGGVIAAIFEALETLKTSSRNSYVPDKIGRAPG